MATKVSAVNALAAALLCSTALPQNASAVDQVVCQRHKNAINLSLRADVEMLRSGHLNRLAQTLTYNFRRNSELPLIGEVTISNGTLSFRVGDPANVEVALSEARRLAEIDFMAGQGAWIASKQAPDKVNIQFNDAALIRDMNVYLEPAQYIILNRLNMYGITDVITVIKGPTDLVVQVPVLEYSANIKKLIIPTGNLNLALVDREADPSDLRQAIAPPGDEILLFPRSSVGVIAVRRIGRAANNKILKAEAIKSTTSGNALIKLTLNAEGNIWLNRVLSLEKNGQIAIILDGQIIGTVKIDSNLRSNTFKFDVGDSNEYAHLTSIILMSGNMPVSMNVYEEKSCVFANRR